MVRTLALLLFAEFADIATTAYASQHGAHEGNPVFLAAAGAGLVGALVFAKLALVPFVGCAIVYAPTPRIGRAVEAAARFGAAMLLGVVASNVLVTL